MSVFQSDVWNLFTGLIARIDLPHNTKNRLTFPSIRVSQSRNPGEGGKTLWPVIPMLIVKSGLFSQSFLWNKCVIWWSGSRKWMRSSWITVKPQRSSAPRSPQARASARERERERERELPITTASGSRVCVCNVSCVWEYIENPIKLTRSVKKDS